MYLLAKFGDHRSYRNGDINCYIKSYMDASYMDVSKKAELTAPIHHIARTLKSEIPFTISKSQIRLVEKQEEEEEHRQLLSIVRFTQTQ